MKAGRFIVSIVLVLTALLAGAAALTCDCGGAAPECDDACGIGCNCVPAAIVTWLTGPSTAAVGDAVPAHALPAFPDLPRSVFRPPQV